MDKKKLNEVEELLNAKKDAKQSVKNRKDGLYEKVNDERVILTEDNKMILND